ncbi:hypothetical protein V8G54_021536 [Vigna mungo]|uniref:Uncharacterized protein n=1 Tax=Vigna mungo TaxID=3915 RepID=A0AAQ3NDH6_VIGMU
MVSCLVPSSSPTILSLFVSTKAATAITMINNIKPMPILLSMLMPLSLPVTFLRIGTMTLSYIGTNTMVTKPVRDNMDAGGISKLLLIFKFIAADCLTKSVDPYATDNPTNTVVSHMGTTFRISFVSSTLVTVANLHGFSFFSSLYFSSTIAALSRNLNLLV